jgi:hypothetical protein
MAIGGMIMLVEMGIPKAEDIVEITMDFWDFMENQDEIQEQLISELGYIWVKLHLTNVPRSV